MDRHLAPGEGIDLLLEDVPGDHRVAELGETGRRDQADPADPDYPDGFLLLAHPLLLPGFGCFFFLVGTSTFAERAIPII